MQTSFSVHCLSCCFQVLWVNASQFRAWLSLSNSRSDWFFQPVPHLSGFTSSTLAAAGSADNFPFDWLIPALDSVPRFQTGNSWWFSLQFLICKPFTDSKLGSIGGSYSSPFVLNLCAVPVGCLLVHAFPPTSRFSTGNGQWCEQSLPVGQAAVIHNCWSVQIHVFVCLV